MKAVIRVITVFLVTGSVFLGCATNKGITGIDTVVTAAGTSEGIVMEFGNIPENTEAVFLRLFDITADGLPAGDPEAVKSTDIYIHEERLAELRKSGNLLCPFVRNGHEYRIDVTVIIDADIGNDFKNPDYKDYSTNAVAGGGIFITNNPKLAFTDNGNTVTLSEIPAFSGKVTYSPNGLFQFSNFVIIDDKMYGGGISHWNELTYPVREVLGTTREHFGFTGNYPVNASVRCLLVSGNYEWAVAVAKADEKAILTF